MLSLKLGWNDRVITNTFGFKKYVPAKLLYLKVHDLTKVLKNNGEKRMCLGIPGQIIEIINDSQFLAKVDVAGIKRPVNIECIIGNGEQPQDCIGDWVLVHVGFAMSRIDAKEAQNTLDLLRELEEYQEEVEAMKSSQEQLES